MFSVCLEFIDLWRVGKVQGLVAGLRNGVMPLTRANLVKAGYFSVRLVPIRQECTPPRSKLKYPGFES